MFKPVFRPPLAACAALTLLACSPSQQRPIAYQLAPVRLLAQTVMGERIGGGAIYLNVQRSADKSQMTVAVSPAAGEATTRTLLVTQADLASATWQLLQELFDGTVDLGGIVYTDAAPTGTWFNAYIQDSGGVLRVANAAVIQGLLPLETYVRNH